MTHTIPVELYDSSLRDGLQGLKVRAGLKTRIDVAHCLDDLGIPFIEGGWPGANPLFTVFFEQMKHETLKHARLTAFGSTRKVGGKAETDPVLQNLLQAETPVVTIFGKSDVDHVRVALNTTEEENLAMIASSVAYLCAQDRDVFYDAEHFFDGYAKNPTYALKTLQIAAEQGASRIVLCDTNGATLPHVISQVMRDVCAFLAPHNVVVGIHAHNDLDCATANTLSALFAGARHVQGTFGGFGERTGNANLPAVIGASHVKTPFRMIDVTKEHQLVPAAYFIGEKMGRPVPLDMPIVGPASTTHKGGVHADAVLRDPGLYEGFEPVRFGNERHIAISGVAGTANLLHWAKKLGIQVDNKRDPRLRVLLARIKSDEEKGIDYELAYGSLELLFRELIEQRKPALAITHFEIADRDGIAEVSLECLMDGETIHEKQQSTKGVFDATFDLLNRIYTHRGYGNLPHIIQYKSEPLDVSDEQSEANMQTTIVFRAGRETWTTTHTHPDRVQADLEALRQGFDFWSLKSQKTA